MVNRFDPTRTTAETRDHEKGQELRSLEEHHGRIAGAGSRRDQVLVKQTGLHCTVQV